MAFAWILVLIAAMTGTRATNKLKRARKNQDEGEYVSLDDTESDTESEDWEQLEAEAAAAKEKAASKGKAPASSTKSKTAPTTVEKGKAPMQSTPMKRKTVAKRKGMARGIEINEPSSENIFQVNSERIKDFEKRECIGERHVNVKVLKERSALFGTLFDQAGLAPICNFPESSGFCLHLVRKFYQNQSKLINLEDGPREFETTVLNVRMKITPQLIGEVLEMEARTDGVHYLKGHAMPNTTWRVVVGGICLPDTRSAGNSVLSKELRPEYRYLNFIVCYNILPNMQTKVLRWDRMLFLYFLGHPTAALGSNFNIPYLIWSRMARYVQNAHPTERLPYPMIIMRIFRRFKIDTSSASYMHSLGTINDTTIVKSLSTRQDETPTPPRGRRPAPTTTSTATASPAARTSLTTASMAEDEISVTSIYQEQRRLSSEQERMSNEFTTMSADIGELKKKLKSLTKLVKKIFQKFGCSSSEESD